MNNTKLSSSVTIAEYKVLAEKENVDGIANLIYDRFYERYIQPFNCNITKHGFSMMAIGCLMIEALYSFQKGKATTKDCSKDAFEEFFANSHYLNEFGSADLDFYHNIRCSLLHQAETNNGWKIRRRGKLIDKKNRTINATKFLKALHKELEDYVSSLKKETFESDLCKKAVKKLDCICNNCQKA